MCKPVSMTLDERFEFLAKNIESLHEAVFENTRQIAQQQEQMARQQEQMARHQEQMALHGQNTDQLHEEILALTRVVSGIANAVSDLALIARNHERRLSNLEGTQ
jgi:prophage DNA circulation protein